MSVVNEIPSRVLTFYLDILSVRFLTRDAVMSAAIAVVEMSVRLSVRHSLPESGNVSQEA